MRLEDVMGKYVVSVCGWREKGEGGGRVVVRGRGVCRW